MKRIEKTKTDFFDGKCVLGFWNTDLKNLRNLKVFLSQKAQKGVDGS